MKTRFPRNSAPDFSHPAWFSPCSPWIPCSCSRRRMMDPWDGSLRVSPFPAWTTSASGSIRRASVDAAEQNRTGQVGERRPCAAPSSVPSFQKDGSNKTLFPSTLDFGIACPAAA
ncbi:unnamed protein product [Ixodes persulcatus]